ncbi:MAG TPA: hypothetical protein VGL46_05115 [Pseudonocardiaceae bacterium]|jgi:hypothetical protein
MTALTVVTSNPAIAPTRTAYALIDLSYEVAVLRCARLNLAAAARAALDAGASWDELDAAIGGLDVVDVLAILTEDSR